MHTYKQGPFFFKCFRPYRRKQPPTPRGGKRLGQVHPPSVSRRRKRPNATGHSYQGHAAACPSPPDSPRGRSALRLRTSRRRLLGLRTFSHPVTALRGSLIGRSRDLHFVLETSGLRCILADVSTDRSARACGVGDCPRLGPTENDFRETSGPRLDRIPPTRPPWWDRQYRELKKLFFSAPGKCPIDLFGPVANGRILE